MTSARALQLPDRRVRLEIGPAGAAGLVIEDNLDWDAQVRFTRASKPNEAEVRIEGLSDATISTHLEAGGIQVDDLVIQIFAGENALGLLFRGTVARRGIDTADDTPQRVTTIRAADGRRIWRDTLFSASWPPGTQVAAAFQAVIAQAGIPVGFASPLPPASQTFASTWSFIGHWRKALNELTIAFGYDWWIDQGSLYLVAYGDDPAAGNVPLITPKTGLHSSPKQTAKGADFECDLDPRIRAGWGVVLESARFDGLYRVATGVHEVASEARSWKTSVQAELIQ